MCRSPCDGSPVNGPARAANTAGCPTTFRRHRTNLITTSQRNTAVRRPPTTSRGPASSATDTKGATLPRSIRSRAWSPDSSTRVGTSGGNTFATRKVESSGRRPRVGRPCDCCGSTFVRVSRSVGHCSRRADGECREGDSAFPLLDSARSFGGPATAAPACARSQHSRPPVRSWPGWDRSRAILKAAAPATNHRSHAMVIRARET